MRCPSCGCENPEGMKFCGECATPLKTRCPSCGFENPPRFKFCGECATPLTVEVRSPESEVRSQTQEQSLQTKSEAERRQLTVMFCDLVGSTALSEKLDPEELREVVRAYQEACSAVIHRFAGHIAQYLGDGVLVYFGYPVAHEDDAQRAVRAGVEIVGAIHELPLLNTRLSRPLQVRIGIHTGLVVVGEIGGGDKRENLALGETPNLAARVQGIAEPDTVVISAATQRLIEGYFVCQPLDAHALKGLSQPVELYRVLGESGSQSRFEVAVRTGLTPLVGRDEELGLLLKRWEQVKEGQGQVVLLSGEAGIGKSRLVQELKEQVAREGYTRIEFRCSPYYQNTAFYPVIDFLQRMLGFAREDSQQEKLRKLEDALGHRGGSQTCPYLSLQEVVPLFAALLSLPHPDGYPPLTLPPQKQKQKTQEALLAWLLAEAERNPLLAAWEDLHWADPSTLELHNLLIDQTPTARILTLMTFRPEFSPPWGTRSHLTQLMLSRLSRKQVREMVGHVVAQTLRPSTSSGRAESASSGETSPVRAEPVEARTALPDDLIETVVTRTDGVPLFVEELTKMVVESGLPVGATHASPLPLAIPATLHDALMARLDRLGTVKEVAQLGATLGREFSYELIQAVSPVDAVSLQQALAKLVEAEVLYQRGLSSQATYVFKHALIQDAAYQSLLKSRRQQYHQQIAQVLEERFLETKETQPELVAHHYTEARLIEQAVPYWQKAGQHAVERSANVEAISHLTTGLELLKTLPDTPERAQQELTLQIALGAPLSATKGYADPEIEKAYTRAIDLCRQLGETPRLFSVLSGLMAFYMARGELWTAHELGEQLLTLARRVRNPTLFLWAHYLMGENLFHLGELVLAREHLEQGITLYGPQRPSPSRGMHNPGVACLSHEALALWHLGYPDQALKKIHEAISLALELSHPLSLVRALDLAAWIHQFRREGQAAQGQAEAALTLCTEQGFPFYWAHGTILWGWALAEQGQGEKGVTQLRQGLAAYRATGAKLSLPYFLALLVQAYGKGGRAEEGLTLLAEALAAVDKTRERWHEAELYRLKGELVLQSAVRSPESKPPNSQSAIRNPQLEAEAEACFHKAVEIARRQSAKSLELRSVMSLSRLW